MRYPRQTALLQTPFQGILYVDGEVLGGANGDDDRIEEVSLDGETITITRRLGRTITVSWEQIKEQTDQGLPRPRLVFVHGARDIGLYFASDTPVGGLELRKPNSLIGALGWLTTEGFASLF